MKVIQSRPLLLAGCLVGILAIAACGSSGEVDAKKSDTSKVDTSKCETLPKRTKVVVGTFPQLSLSTYYIAQKFGYFDDQNLDVESANLSATQDAIALLAKGKIDVALGSFSANLFNGINSGFEVKGVASQGQQSGTKLPSGFYVRTATLKSGEIKTMADLKGHKVAISGTVGGASSYLVGLMLAEGNLTLSDVQPVSLQYPEMNAALKSGAVDAAFVGSPFNALVEDDDSGRLFGDQSAMANETQAALLFGPNLLQKHPEVARAYLRANMLAARKLQGKYNQDDAVVQALVDTAGFEKKTVLATPEYVFDPDLKFNPETISKEQEMFSKLNLLTGKILPFEKVIDETIRTQAAETLAACTK